MTIRIASLCLMALAFLPTGARAQVVWPPAVFSPEAPTSLQAVRATFTVPAGCGVETATAVEGLTVRTTVTLSDCPAGPPLLPVSHSVDFGPLPAGSYLYEIVFESDDSPPEVRSQQTLVVAAALPQAPGAFGRRAGRADVRAGGGRGGRDARRGELRIEN